MSDDPLEAIIAELLPGIDPEEAKQLVEVEKQRLLEAADAIRMRRERGEE
jgi:hypothetical protein